MLGNLLLVQQPSADQSIEILRSFSLCFDNAELISSLFVACRGRNRDKSTRATTSQVLDERTRLVINKMITQGRFDEITGSISVGKEANVFRAEKHTESGTEYYALKVGGAFYCVVFLNLCGAFLIWIADLLAHKSGVALCVCVCFVFFTSENVRLLIYF